jgi:hypothetical protein
MHGSTADRTVWGRSLTRSEESCGDGRASKTGLLQHHESGLAVSREPIKESRTHCQHAFAFLSDEYGCKQRARYLPSGYELCYWNATTAVRLDYFLRDPLFEYIGPRPEGAFPPAKEDYVARNRIELFELLDIVEMVTSRRPTFDDEVRYAIPSMALVEQYADWTRQYCDGLLDGDFAMLGELRRRLRARIEATDQFPR